MSIEMTDITLKYITIEEARRLSGLRIVLGAYPIPGPWRESCKGVFHVKGLRYTPVKSANAEASDLAIGMHDTQSELIAWTGQSSAPVVAWNDERPRSNWLEQLHLAERLNPEPPLIPSSSEDRIRMFGLANELLGEQGLVWLSRCKCWRRTTRSAGFSSFWVGNTATRRRARSGLRCRSRKFSSASASSWRASRRRAGAI